MIVKDNYSHYNYNLHNFTGITGHKLSCYNFHTFMVIAFIVINILIFTCHSFHVITVVCFLTFRVQPLGPSPFWLQVSGNNLSGHYLSTSKPLWLFLVYLSTFMVIRVILIFTFLVHHLSNHYLFTSKPFVNLLDIRVIIRVITWVISNCHLLRFSLPFFHYLTGTYCHNFKSHNSFITWIISCLPLILLGSPDIKVFH